MTRATPAVLGVPRVSLFYTRARSPSAAALGQRRSQALRSLRPGGPPPRVSLPRRLPFSAVPRFWAARPAGHRLARTPLLMFHGRLRPLGPYCVWGSTPRVCRLCLSAFSAPLSLRGNVRGRAGPSTEIFSQKIFFWALVFSAQGGARLRFCLSARSTSLPLSASRGGLSAYMM